MLTRHTSDIMDTNVSVLFSPEHSLYSAVRYMNGRDDEMLPVAEGQRLVGMLTKRCILHAVTSGINLHDVQVKDIMSQKLIFCYGTDTLEYAAHIMGTHRVHQLTVLNKDHDIVGILTLPAILEAISEGRAYTTILRLLLPVMSGTPAQKSPVAA